MSQTVLKRAYNVFDIRKGGTFALNTFGLDSQALNGKAGQKRIYVFCIKTYTL